MAKVGIVMGSDSDMPIMSKAGNRMSFLNMQKQQRKKALK